MDKPIEILIVSDVHGHTAALRRVLDAHRAAKYVLFLGDGARDFEECTADFPGICVSVRGNCDIACFDVPEERIFELYGHTVLMTHGHRHGVKYGLGPLAAYARSRGADVVLFGHTHEKHDEYEGGDAPLWLFNPGSLGEARDAAPSFGVLTLAEGGIVFSHGQL